MKKRKLIKVGKINKKRIIIFSINLFIVIFGLFTYLFIFNKNIFKSNVIFKLNTPITQVLEVNTEYQELGCSVYVNGENNTNKIKVDITSLNNKVLGEYKIKYYIKIKKKEYSYYRKVKVVDTTIPEIILNGNETINLVTGDKYEEQGAVASDNYDGDITDKIEISGEVDTKEIGEYTITYKIVDTSGNENTITRKIIVSKPKKIVYENKYEEKAPIKSNFNADNYNNTITLNKFTSTGIYIEGTKKENNGTYKMLLDDKYSFDMTSNGSNYKGNINIENIDNGTYNLYIDSNGSEPLLNKLDYMNKIVRSKVGNKLVTLKYNNDQVTMQIEDFSYQYDVLIDPGHGSDDTGASNQYIYEKDMNLTVSRYEKCRFESMGFSVYMTRNSDTYGNGLGNAEKRVHRRSYEIGYYGAVSKVVYSNHHNAINISSYMGYEMLIPGGYTSSELTPEITIANKFNSIYPLNESHLRFFATNYDTEAKYSMLNGNTYTFNDNYAVNRIPYKLFNTKAIIYEGCYLTNSDDFKWYWTDGNWKKVSEVKIETYVNYMGGSYNSDNGGC